MTEKRKGRNLAVRMERRLRRGRMGVARCRWVAGVDKDPARVPCQWRGGGKNLGGIKLTIRSTEESPRPRPMLRVARTLCGRAWQIYTGGSSMSRRWAARLRLNARVETIVRTDITIRRKRSKMVPPVIMETPSYEGRPQRARPGSMDRERIDGSIASLRVDLARSSVPRKLTAMGIVEASRRSERGKATI